MAFAAYPQPCPWELHALDYHFQEVASAMADSGKDTRSATWRQTQDALIYPGLYSSSGFDVMSILIQVMSRPHPIVELGPIDCSVALILCDLDHPETPIVYASDSFCELTGYSRSEVIGQDCGFLQLPGGMRSRSMRTRATDGGATQTMRDVVQSRQESQFEVVSYKKNGQQFTNILTIIPVTMNDTGAQYAVGLSVELE